MSLLLLFNYCHCSDEPGYRCNNCSLTPLKFVPSGADFKNRKYSGGGVAVIPAITVCNQQISKYIDVEKLADYKEKMR
jgi:hypothetical protein